MAWYNYLLNFVAGAFLANGVPHFVQGISGNPFPTPFAIPAGVGDSSPRVNVVWGFLNLAVGELLLHFFRPEGEDSAKGWAAVALGAFLLSMQMASHFGKVRAKKV
jgi:hypothetical protein